MDPVSQPMHRAPPLPAISIEWEAQGAASILRTSFDVQCVCVSVVNNDFKKNFSHHKEVVCYARITARHRPSNEAARLQYYGLEFEIRAVVSSFPTLSHRPERRESE